jgi:hypothetical protein
MKNDKENKVENDNFILELLSYKKSTLNNNYIVGFDL